MEDDLEWTDYVYSYNGGNSVGHKPDEYFGMTILKAEKTENNRIRLVLSGDKIIEIWDSAEYCCETRWLTTDDDLTSLVNHKLVRIDKKPGPSDEEGEAGNHDTMFVEIGTDQNFVTLVTHNDHNGYYGGFEVCITEVANG